MSLPLVDIGQLLTIEPPDLPDLTAEIGPAEVPLALLPVRLETRFVRAANGLAELWVRIYPDKIHLDAHDPRLSAVEAAAGRAYWQAEWRCGADEARLRAAWRGLTDRLGPGRAAYVARRLAPTNAGARPDRTIGPDEPLSTEPTLPDPGPPAERTATPVARLLPDRWTAVAYARGQLAAVVTGNDIRPELPIGPNLDAPVRTEGDGPAIDAGMAWMIDFDEAERAGMALRLPLDSTVVDARVDLLVVSGVRSEDPASSAQAYAGAAGGAAVHRRDRVPRPGYAVQQHGRGTAPDTSAATCAGSRASPWSGARPPRTRPATPGAAPRPSA